MQKTTCSKCGNPKEESRGNGGYCKICHNANMRATRPKYKDLPPLVKRREITRAYARSYLKLGIIKRQPCEVCAGYAQMHHDDYDKPLQVKWYCRKHHLELHKKNVPRVTYQKN